MQEFELINQYINQSSVHRSDVLNGIGDDCAILNMPINKQLAVSMDTLVADVHFPQQVSAKDIGYKALAVNLSDLAAVGAEPAWATLSLVMPQGDENWLNAFMKGFNELANQFQVQLVGGDTTQGPLTITVQIQGFVDKDRYLSRSSARIGDLVYVSGTLGDAGLGLLHYTTDKDVPDYCVQRLNRPTPRIELGLALSSIAHAGIDISDGLLADLGHIADMSQCGAEIHLDKLPLSSSFRDYFKKNIDWSLPLSAGDDYELCFTVSADKSAEIEQLSLKLNLPLTCVGMITAEHGVKCLTNNGEIYTPQHSGYEHYT